MNFLSSLLTKPKSPRPEPKDPALNPTETWEKWKDSQTFLNMPPIISSSHARGARLRFVCISDTHGKHRDVAVPDGDVIFCLTIFFVHVLVMSLEVLIHAGDFTNTGEVEQVRDLHDWMAGLPHTHKIIIAGNHDNSFQPNFYETCRQSRKKTDPLITRAILTESKHVPPILVENRCVCDFILIRLRILKILVTVFLFLPKAMLQINTFRFERSLKFL
jgi:hypothetical protein